MLTPNFTTGGGGIEGSGGINTTDDEDASRVG